MRAIISFMMVILCLSFMGCTKVIDLESLRPDPVLVVNSVAVAGEPFTASVSRTWFITDNNPNIVLDRADVNLFVNDRFIEKMLYKQSPVEGYNSWGYFCSGYLPVAGDRIRMEVNEPDYKQARAETVVPQPVDLLSASIQSEPMDPGIPFYRTKITYTITFRDNAATSDYYLLRLEESQPEYDEKGDYTGTFKWFPAQPDYSTEPLFGQSITSLDDVLGNNWLNGSLGRVFSDELINGRTYTIRLTGVRYDYGNADPEMNAPKLHFRAFLSTVSKEFYLYMKALQDQSDDTVSNMLINGGLAEPVRVYSNIEDGVGIMGACYQDMLEVEE